MFHDLSQLGDFQFTRCAINDDLPSDLYIFCDAAKKAYGFSAYSVQDNNTHLVFAKAKVSPMKSKSLPTLELLSVYLAVLSLPSLLESYAKVKFNNVIIAVDAQIVLSWLLSNVVKSKNQFVKNRLKDIHNMVSEISEKISVNVSFKYVPSENNPADMITRGLSTDKFKQQLDVWVSGPEWLQSTPVD